MSTPLLSCRSNVRAAAAAAAAVAVSVLALVAGAPVAHAAVPDGHARSLAVSVPPDPISIEDGGVGKTMVRVVNPDAAPVPVTISARSLSFGNEGRVLIGSAPDPVGPRLGAFPTRSLVVPGRGYLDVPLTIHVPPRLSPDLYFLGFLVTPVPTRQGDLQVINQIGSFVTVDVPGPRERSLAGTLDVPLLAVGSHATGTLKIGNVGRAAVRFWGEDDTTSTPGGSTPTEQRFEPSLLPRGTVRSFTVVSKPAWPVGVVTMTVHLVYPGRTDATTKELLFRRRVLVVSPYVLVAVALSIAAAAAWLVLRRRSRATTRP